jgi:hypothetical protein
MKNDDNHFKSWLLKTKKYQPKVACDILSRKRRIIKIRKYDIGQNVNSYLMTLDEDKSFQRLAITVKSQLRRSMRLFAEFSCQ